MRRVVTIFDDGDVDGRRAGEDGRGGGHAELARDSAREELSWRVSLSVVPTVRPPHTTCWLGLVPTTTWLYHQPGPHLKLTPDFK